MAMIPASHPVVSVCIANYNGEHLLERCIASVLAQENAPAFEIIVHDDASTDRSLSVLQRYPDVRVIASPHNVGFCIANNRMAETAKGTFLLLLNNDARLLRDALSTLLVTSAHWSHRAVLGLPQFTPDGRLVDRGARLDPFMNPVPITVDARDPPATLQGACMWVPSACWHELGGFPEYFAMNVEDVYLCCKARMAGMEVRVPHASGYLHDGGATFGAGPDAATPNRWVSTARRRYLSERNKLLVMLVFLPAPLLVLLLPLHVLLLVVEAVAVAAHNRRAGLLRDPYLRAVADVVSLCPRALVDRRGLASTQARGRWALLGRFSPVPHKLRLLLARGVPELRGGAR